MRKSSVTFDEFVSRAKLKHENKYIYVEQTFSAMSKSVTILCRVHGEFQQRADMHVSGQNCPRCGYANRQQTFKDTPRKIAQREGKSTYTTGEPCPKGHITERRTHNGECVTCAAQKNKERMEHLRQEQPEKLKQYKQTEYQRNKTKRLAANQKWAKKNPEKVAAIFKRWREKNKKQFAAIVADWRRRNPAAYRMQKYRRRMLEATADGIFTEADLTHLLEQQTGFCIGCNADITTTFTIDHKTPLSRGGSNDPANLQLLCKSCNSSKGTKTNEEWRAS